MAALEEALGCIVLSSVMIARGGEGFPLGGGGVRQVVRSILVFGGGGAGFLFVEFFLIVVGYDVVLLLWVTIPA